MINYILKLFYSLSLAAKLYRNTIRKNKTKSSAIPIFNWRCPYYNIWFYFYCDCFLLYYNSFILFNQTIERKENYLISSESPLNIFYYYSLFNKYLWNFQINTRSEKLRVYLFPKLNLLKIAYKMLEALIREKIMNKKILFCSADILSLFYFDF